MSNLMYQMSYFISILGKYETGWIDSLCEGESREEAEPEKEACLKTNVFSNQKSVLGYINSRCPITFHSCGQLSHALRTSLGLAFVVNTLGYSYELKSIIMRRVRAKDNKRSTSWPYFQDKTKNYEDESKVRKENNIKNSRNVDLK